MTEPKCCIAAFTWQAYIRETGFTEGHVSDRLAISASFSVLMMALYVLFGDNVHRVPLGPLQLLPSVEPGLSVKTPELPHSPGDFLKILD